MDRLLIDFQIRRLNLEGRNRGLAFTNGFRVFAANNEIEFLISIWDISQSGLPSIVANAEWMDDCWKLNKNGNSIADQIANQISICFDVCDIPHDWIVR